MFGHRLALLVLGCEALAGQSQGRCTMMRTTWIGVALVLCGLIVLGDAFGFTRGGREWPRDSIPVGYFTNPAGLPAEWEVAVQRGHQTWNNVSNQYMRYAWRGQTSRPTVRQDGQNTIGRMADPSRYGETTFAITFMRGNGEGGYREFDIAFNPNKNWTTDPSRGADMVGVAAHEFGHALGLGHSRVRTATMWFAPRPGWRWLDPDDINGVRTIYPGGGTATGVTVSGNVTASGGQPMAGVSIAATINGLSRNTTTDAMGGYQFLRVPRGVLTLRPSMSGRTFTPAFRQLTVGTTDIAGQDFVGR